MSKFMKLFVKKTAYKFLFNSREVKKRQICHTHCNVVKSFEKSQMATQVTINHKKKKVFRLSTGVNWVHVAKMKAERKQE